MAGVWTAWSHLHTQEQMYRFQMFSPGVYWTHQSHWWTCYVNMRHYLNTLLNQIFEGVLTQHFDKHRLKPHRYGSVVCSSFTWSITRTANLIKYIYIEACVIHSLHSSTQPAWKPNCHSDEQLFWNWEKAAHGDYHHTVMHSVNKNIAQKMTTNAFNRLILPKKCCFWTSSLVT